MKDKTEGKKQQIVFWGTVLVFLTCYFMMLFDFPNILTILFGSLVCLLLLIKQKRFRLDLGTILLCITMASYFLIVFGKRGATMSLPYVGLVMYVLGNYLGGETKTKEHSEKLWILLLFTLIVGHSIHGILNSALFLDKQWDNGDIRVWKDFWMNIYIPGTQQIVYFLPVIAMVFPAIAYFKNRKTVNLLMILTALFFIYISMYSQTRTSVLIFPLVFAAQAALYVILEWKKVKKLLSNRKVQAAGLGVLLTGVIALILLKDHPIVSGFLGIMGRDGGIFNNIRFQLQRMALDQLFLYPMGGDHMSFMGYPYAHNAWLDMANFGGLIPFFAFSAYTFLTVYELIRWLMKKEIPTERKLILTGIYGAFFLYYTVEHAFDASMHFMTPWFFINGLVHAELTKEKKTI